MLNILLGSLPGVWLGSGATGRMQSRGLRLAIATVLLASGLALLAKSGLPVPPPAILALPAAIGLFLSRLNSVE